jgi:hypothetical protein
VLVSRTRAAVAAGALAAVLAGAWAAASWADPPEKELAEALAYEEPPADSAASSCGPPLHETLASLDEVLGNVRFRASDGTERSYTDAVVVGRFTDVRRGSGYVLPEPDGPGDLPVAYDDPAAIYRSVHGVLAVESVVSGEVPADEILVRFQTWEDDHERYEEGLPALGRVVLPLIRSVAQDVADDPSVLEPLDHLAATVAEDGRLALPLLPEEHAERLLDRTPTLTALEDAAEERPRTIRVDICHNPVR